MTQRAGKTLDQVLEDLNNMISGIGKNKSQGGSRDQSSGGGGRGGFGGGGGSQQGSAAGGSPLWQFIFILAFVVIYGGVSSFYKINTTEQGVITRFGAVHSVVSEGPHFRLPFGIDQVYKVEVTRIHEEQFGFRANDLKELSPQEARLESLMLTGDLKVAVVEWSLQYKVTDPKKFLFSAVGVQKNIRDISISVMRRVVGDRLVSDVLTTDRRSIAESAKTLTQETLDLFNMGVTIVNLTLQKVLPPESVQAAFHEVNIARQEKDQLINQAKGEYNKVIPEAEGKALRQVAEAKGYAINVVNRSKGEAERFKSMLAAYKTAPEVTRKRMYLEMMEEVLSKVSRFSVIDPQLKGILPIYNAEKFGRAEAMVAKAAEEVAEAVMEEKSKNGK